MKLLLLKCFCYLFISVGWVIPVYGQGISSDSAVNASDSVMQMLLGLIAVLAMIFAVVWLLKKVGYQGYQNNNHMKIKACLPLSTKEKLMLVEIGKQQLLIGVGPGFVNHIADIDDEVEMVTDKEKSQVGATIFADKLKAIISKGEAVE